MGKSWPSTTELMFNPQLKCLTYFRKHPIMVAFSITFDTWMLLKPFRNTEALKGHRVVWKIEICYLIRMTYEWKPMSSGWHNNIVVTHPDEIPISAKSPGWHTVYDMSSGWHTAVSKSHPDEIRPGANSSGWLRVQMTLCHPDDIGEYRKSSGWHPTMPISHPDVIPPIVKSSGWDTANS